MPRNMDGPQQITRIPEFRPGAWIKIGKGVTNGGADLSGKVRRVKSLIGSLTETEPARVTWRCHFADGRYVEARHVERLATESEIAAAQANGGPR